MTKSLLVTRPKHDETTSYLYCWASLVIELAKAKNYSVYDLAEEKANPELLTSYLQKNDPGLVFFNGHGNSKQIAGHHDVALIELGKNEELLRNRIVYALSCSTASSLGKGCVSKGTTAYIGYSSEYVLATKADCISRPLQDDVAKLFLEPSNLVISTLIKGNTPQEAYDRAKSALIKNFRFSLSSLASHEQREVGQYLWVDINIFTLL